jgi:hypothetical protein
MTAVPDAAQRATALLASVAGHDWPAARASFGATMAAALDDAGLDRAWAQVSTQMGGYLGMGEPEVAVTGDHTDVTVPLNFEHGPMEGRVSFDAAGAVSGLHFLFSGEPGHGREAPDPDLFLRCSDGHLYLASRHTLLWRTIHFGAKQLRPCPVDGRWRIAEFVDPSTLSRGELEQAAAHRI